MSSSPARSITTVLASATANATADANAHIDLAPLHLGLGRLAEALMLWQQQAEGSILKPHLRSAVIQSFEVAYELSIRMLRRVLMERAASADRVTDLSFNDLLRQAADAGLLSEPMAWRTWRALRNATSHAYDEARAEAVAGESQRFLADAQALLSALRLALGATP